MENVRHWESEASVLFAELTYDLTHGTEEKEVLGKLVELELCVNQLSSALRDFRKLAGNLQEINHVQPHAVQQYDTCSQWGSPQESVISRKS